MKKHVHSVELKNANSYTGQKNGLKIWTDM
jgi:hypothetical protein